MDDHAALADRRRRDWRRYYRLQRSATRDDDTNRVPHLQSEPAVWIDNANLPVMVDGGQYGSMATIDNVCPR